MAQAVSSPSTFGFAPLITLLLPARSLPNQVADVLGECSGLFARGLGGEAVAQHFIDSFSAAPAGCGQREDEEKRKSLHGAHAHGVFLRSDRRVSFHRRAKNSARGVAVLEWDGILPMGTPVSQGLTRFSS